MKLDVISYFQIVQIVSHLYAHYPIFSFLSCKYRIVMLHIVHTYKIKVKSDTLINSYFYWLFQLGGYGWAILYYSNIKYNFLNNIIITMHLKGIQKQVIYDFFEICFLLVF